MSTNIPRMVSACMATARRDANWLRINGFEPLCCTVTHENAVLLGMRLATVYLTDGMRESDRDAFTAAHNELNFLFGRYQERT